MVMENRGADRETDRELFSSEQKHSRKPGSIPSEQIFSFNQ
jgi:hypothetical protein